MAKNKPKKDKQKDQVVTESVELNKYYFLANVYAVVAVEAEDVSEAKKMVKEIEAKDFINFQLKKAKLITPKLYAPVVEEDEEDEEEEVKKSKKRKGKKGKNKEIEDEDMEAQLNPA